MKEVSLLFDTITFVFSSPIFVTLVMYVVFKTADSLIEPFLLFD